MIIKSFVTFDASYFCLWLKPLRTGRCGRKSPRLNRPSCQLSLLRKYLSTLAISFSNWLIFPSNFFFTVSTSLRRSWQSSSSFFVVFFSFFSSSRISLIIEQADKRWSPMADLIWSLSSHRRGCNKHKNKKSP